MRTPWGYDVDAAVDPIVDVSDFNRITGGAFAANPRVEAALMAASQAVRNACGWHVSPSLECTAHPVGGGAVLRLPAGYISDITSITENDAEISATGYQWRSDGLVRRIYPHKWTDVWNGIEVVYTAGYEADAVPDLVEAVVAIASGVLSVSAGVISESADGVSVSYSANASSIAAALTAQQQAALAPYKVVNSHAS